MDAEALALRHLFAAIGRASMGMRSAHCAPIRRLECGATTRSSPARAPDSTGYDRELLRWEAGASSERTIERLGKRQTPVVRMPVSEPREGRSDRCGSQ